MGKFKRISVIVVDSSDIRDDRDAKAYGDESIDIMECVVGSVDHWEIPNLQGLGMTDMYPLKGVVPMEKPMGYYTIMDENSCGKDTMTRHWGLMGTKTVKSFMISTETGFPKELIEELEKRVGHKVVGNESPSGTITLGKLAEGEIATGHMIVYASADSVLRICGNEETFGLDELYRCCEIVRELIMRDEWRMGRVTVRPYVGKKGGEFKYTSNRHDYAPRPAGKTALDVLRKYKFEVISVGKIRGISDGEDIIKAYKPKSSIHGMEQTADIIKDEDFEGLCFVSLVDFDALWGHRRNPQGYVKEVKMFGVKLGGALADLREDGLLMITTDHGNDPTYSSTDHTREQVPLLIYPKQFEGSGMLKETDTFAAVGATIAEDFEVKMPGDTIGSSILGQLSQHCYTKHDPGGQNVYILIPSRFVFYNPNKSLADMESMDRTLIWPTFRVE